MSRSIPATARHVAESLGDRPERDGHAVSGSLGQHTRGQFALPSNAGEPYPAPHRSAASELGQDGRGCGRLRQEWRVACVELDGIRNALRVRLLERNGKGLVVGAHDVGRRSFAPRNRSRHTSHRGQRHGAQPGNRRTRFRLGTIVEEELDGAVGVEAEDVAVEGDSSPSFMFSPPERLFSITLSPSSSTNAVMYTRCSTLGCTPASVMTAPP
jgi:hypothetical protein